MKKHGIMWTAAGLLGLVAILALPAAADVVINDDLIVIGSACIGFDCVNGENFGFDTLRLKENNLRLNFADTSNSASFPTNDWRIVANDTTNGGGNYLGIEDSSAGRIPFRVEAGARSNALYVESDGDVGIGTNNPVVDLHIVTGNTPTLRLDQDGSSGFTPQVWDVAGNEANFFVRDATNGSKLALKIKPGAPTSSLFLAASGNVGLTEESPDQKLHLTTNGTTLVKVESTNAGQAGMRFVTTGASAPADGWSFITNTGGNFIINSVSVGPGNEVVINPTTGDMTLLGDLITGGTGTCAPPNPACDGVFQPDYALESIEEHAAFMWANSHLPAVGPTAAGKGINLTVKTQGILNELEKAHIYIEDLHQRLEEDTAMASLLDRLEKLEAALAVN